MGTGLLSSAVSGMQVAQFALQTAQHNITNQNTPGFNRQRTVQSSNIAMLTGAGFIGQGSHVSTVERVYDSFLGNQVNRAQTTSSELDTYYTQIAQIDNMLADPDSGLSPALQSFFNGVQQVAANPAQLPSRQAMISSAQTLVARFQGIEARISQMYQDVNTQLSTEVATVNSYSRQIVELNQSIVIAESSINQPANDLLDQRDQLVSELNKLIKVTTITNSDGSFNVFFGTGQQLVVGTQAMTMTARPSAADPSKFAVGLSNAGGNQELPESLITGGSIGGLLKFRSESLDRTQNDFSRTAASLALTFNAQHALGQDLLGQAADDAFFTISIPKVVAHNPQPAGSPTVTANYISPPPYNGNFYTDLTSSDYRLDSNGTIVTLTRLTDGVSWVGADVTALNAAVATSKEGSQGFTIASSGALVAGSSYVIQPTKEAARNIGVNATIAADARLIAAAAGPPATSGVSDNRNALLLGQLQTQNTMSGKTASYQTAYAQLVSDVGNKTRQLSVTGEAQQALLKQSQAARDSLSGVNLDEEAANLIRFQQAYQASAKSLQIGAELFDTLLGIMN